MRHGVALPGRRNCAFGLKRRVQLFALERVEYVKSRNLREPSDALEVGDRGDGSEVERVLARLFMVVLSFQQSARSAVLVTLPNRRRAPVAA